MKKKIARIHRWLNRLSSACESRRWDSAIVEADCLDAEVRELRKDLCSLLDDPETSNHRVFSAGTVGMSIKSIGIAVFIVLASTIPLAVEADRPWGDVSAKVSAEKSSEHLSWVTEEEDQLIHMLRADLSSKNGSFSANAENFKPAPVSSAKKTVKTTGPQTLKTEVKERTDTLVTTEDLLALIQVGEKALRGRDSMIKIIN